MSTLLLVALFSAELSAEFWGRTMPLKDDAGQLKAVASDSHLVVEATIKAAKGHPVRVTTGQFLLRINGAKIPLATDSPSAAAAAAVYPNWDNNRGLEAQAGPVILGRRRPVPRFPGDPAERSGAAEGPEVGQRLDQAMAAASWNSVDVVNERTGLLFFAWKGKVSKIKTLELIWKPVDEAEKLVRLR